MSGSSRFNFKQHRQSGIALEHPRKHRTMENVVQIYRCAYCERGREICISRTVALFRSTDGQARGKGLMLLENWAHGLLSVLGMGKVVKRFNTAVEHDIKSCEELTYTFARIERRKRNIPVAVERRKHTDPRSQTG